MKIDEQVDCIHSFLSFLNWLNSNSLKFSKSGMKSSNIITVSQQIDVQTHTECDNFLLLSCPNEFINVNYF